MIALKSDSSNRGFHILDMVNENNLLTYIFIVRRKVNKVTI